MYKKLGLMCVLLNRPRLLLLDEPTIGVDPVSRQQLWDLVYFWQYCAILAVICLITCSAAYKNFRSKLN